ncbi:MMPL family transporter [Winogradskya consettensis]|uniref:Membrane protein n=1 Tax=Winogradskya consettensis TaxID=113560 RepID=A0A919SK71_9ACTN|nr:MMPL family transporter [Actinoplanes consettensis]GIM74280.1 membrane protein [Actinoplanes consettensis]
MARFLARIGGFSARRRWLIVVLWIALLAAAAGGAAAWSKPLDPDFTIDGLASVGTLQRIDAEFGISDDPGGDIVFAAPAGQSLTAGDKATITRLSSDIAALPGVAAAPATTLSPGGRVGLLSVTLTGDDVPAGLAGVVDAARGPGLRIELSAGLAPAAESSSSTDIGLLIALVVLVVTFGSLVAAGVPLVTALLGLGVSLAGIYAATRFIALSDVAPSLALLLGLAVGIDYALFVVNRHRRQLIDGVPVRQSIALAVGTAGTAVVFAALTVIIALAGLAVMRVGFLTQMGVSAAVAVAIAMLITVTLTPALLSIAGPRILGRRTRRRLAAGTVPAGGKYALRWAGWIARFPALGVLIPVVLLGALAIPVLHLRLGLPTDGSEPSTSTVRQAYDLKAAGFGAGVNAPILVVGTAAAEQGLDAVPGVARVVPSGEHGGQVLLTVYPTGGPEAESTTTLVHDLRERPGLEVTGTTAIAIDVSDLLAARLPGYLALIIGFAFLLLLVVFRSVLVALKAVVSFLLSLGAALGCTVLVFQQGHLAGPVGVDPAGPLLSFLPVIVIGVLFGLSMDYEMFLLTGIHEEHARGADPRGAVRTGFAHGAKVIAAAALIMIGVFGSGALGHGDNTIKPIAFSLAAGTLADAFLVRMMLVPAVMTLFGRAAWWLPRWLNRVLPHLDIEGSQLAPSTPPGEPSARLYASAGK